MVERHKASTPLVSKNRVRQKDFNDLHMNVIAAGLCSACGTCIGTCPSNVIEFDYECGEPRLIGKCVRCRICDAVCPGKYVPLADMEKALFGRERTMAEFDTGIYRRYLKAYATDPVIRQAGASGGIVSALLIYALEKGLITGAALAGMSTEKPWRGVPILATDRAAVLRNARSKYTLVPNNAALKEAMAKGISSIAVAGVPCQIHGLRKLQAFGKSAKLAKSIRLSIGLFCGGNSTHEITEWAIAKYSGIPLDQVAKCEYRGGPQSQDFIITARDGTAKVIPQWGWLRTIMRAQRDRCALCFDFSAEVADISVGDIFTPGPDITKVPRVSAVFARTEHGDEMLAAAEKDGWIVTEPLDIGTIYDNGGLQAKKYFAPYYLRERSRYGWPAPDYGADLPFRMPPPIG